MITKAKRAHNRIRIQTRATILVQIVGALFLLYAVDCSVVLNNRTITKTHVDVREQITTKGNNVRFNEISILRNKCNSAEKNLDTCSAQLIAFSQSGALYPNNMQEINSIYCPKFKNIVDCIKSSTNCYRPFERQIINWILTSTRRINYKRCKNESEKIRFLRMSNSCFSQMKHPTDRCMSNYVSSLEAIAGLNEYFGRFSEDDIQVQLSCCANMRFKQCVINNAKHQCKPTDSLKKLKRTNSVSSQRMAQKQIQRAMLGMIEDLKSTLDKMALTGPEFICQNIKEEFCRDKYDGRFNGRPSKHKSIVPAMIKIYINK